MFQPNECDLHFVCVCTCTPVKERNVSKKGEMFLNGEATTLPPRGREAELRRYSAHRSSALNVWFLQHSNVLFITFCQRHKAVNVRAVEALLKLC